MSNAVLITLIICGSLTIMFVSILVAAIYTMRREGYVSPEIEAMRKWLDELDKEHPM